MGKRGPKPREAEEREWTPDLAYCIGLIATDGCLYNNGKGIDFTSADIQLVETFKKLLSLQNKITYKKSGTSDKKCPHIQFGNVGFYRWLVSIGLTPKKSLTLGPLHIPHKYFIDFTRGCFDGDGSIYSYMDNRWADSHMFYISFASGSSLFVSWLQKELLGIAGIRGHISSTNGLYQLRFAKAESLVLIQKMYYNQQVPCLERKRRKTIEVLKKHRYVQTHNPRIFLKRTRILDI